MTHISYQKVPGSRALRLSHQSSSLPTAHLRDFCTWKQCNGTKISNTKKKKRLFCVASRNRHTQKFLDGGNTAMTRRGKKLCRKGKKDRYNGCSKLFWHCAKTTDKLRLFLSLSVKHCNLGLQNSTATVQHQHSTFNSVTKQSCQSRPKGKNLSMISH